MNKILMLVFIYAFSIIPSTQAGVKNEQKDSIFLSYCTHFGSGVSYSFASCVNSNFSSINRSIGGFYSYCANYGDEVGYGFTSCVNSGFREAQRQLGNHVWLQDCMNFDRTTLDFSFISCVNSNYNTIQRAIRSK